MTREYSAEETRIWRAARPKKTVDVKVIIKSNKENFLLVKPNYKKTWQFPGGGVEDSESPKEAAVREIYEELGLDVVAEDLTLKDIIYKQDDKLLIIVYEKKTPIDEDVRLKVQEDDITTYEFYSLEVVRPLLATYYLEFWDGLYLK